MAAIASTKTQARGYTVAIVAAVLLSTTGIFIRYLTQTYAIPALILAFWRDVFVVVTLVPALAIARPGMLRPSARHLPYIALYGFILALFNSLWTLSVALNGAAVSTVLVYSSGAFTAIMGRIFLKERLGWAKLAAVAMSFCGCALVAGILDLGSWKGNLAGVLIGVVAGISYALYSLFGRSAANRGLDPWTTLVYIFAFAAAFLFLVNCLPGAPLPGSSRALGDLLWFGASWRGWLVLFLIAAIPTVGGFGLYNVSLSILPSSVANLIMSLEPAFTAALAFLLLGERLTGVQLAGAGLIVGGVLVLRLFEGPRPRGGRPP
ncbi:MAG: DMT family transporter [Rectinemataceae bacterium]|jgi:drug/metabolite transporter (DMT)-like permease